MTLREHLEPPTDEARISRMWAGIAQRRSARRVPPVAWGVGALAAAAAIGLAIFAWPSAPPPTVAAPAAPAPTGLTTADGDALETLESAADARVIAMDDGSEIALSPNTHLETIENDADRFSLLLARGEARFSVRPGGPRRWTVESGLATVEVVGTVFTVNRGESGVNVSVERGVVLVRGERVPDRVARLRAGDRLSVVDEELAVAEVAPPAPAPEPVRPPRREPRGIVEISPAGAEGLDGLLERAEAARREGDTDGQARYLRRASIESDDPRAALAAFTLGRLEMDRLRRPARARAAFERALSLGLPGRLEQQARARLDRLR